MWFLPLSHCLASFIVGNHSRLRDEVGSIMCLECLSFNAPGPGLERKDQLADKESVCTAESSPQLSIHCHPPDLVETSTLPLVARKRKEGEEARYESAVAGAKRRKVTDVNHSQLDILAITVCHKIRTEVAMATSRAKQAIPSSSRNNHIHCPNAL